MSEIVRISAQEARDAVQGGNALLVCAYDSDEKFKSFHLEGGMSFSDFKVRVDGLSKDTGIVFYCA